MQLRGQMPSDRHAALRRFVRSLRLPIGSRILAHRGGRDRFRLSFSGNIPVEDCRRLESFIHEHPV